MDNAYNRDKVIECFENGTFLKVYGNHKLHRSSSIVKQLDDLIIWLNGTFIPQYYLSIKNFSEHEKNEIVEKSTILRKIFYKINKVHTRMIHSGASYSISCSKCNATVSIPLEEDAWSLIQQHEHLEEILLTNMEEKKMEHVIENYNSCEILNDNTNRTCDNCSALITIPTNFKFNFNIVYDAGLENIFYTGNEFRNEKVNVDGNDFYTLRIIDDMCECLICFTHVAIKCYDSHLNGKRHLTQKKCEKSLADLAAFHVNWMRQELLYQCHQIYFIPLSKYVTICQLCDSHKVSYDLIQSHLLSDKHKKEVMRLHRSHKLPLFQLQVRIYEEQVDDFDTVDNTIDNLSNGLVQLNLSNENCVAMPQLQISENVLKTSLLEIPGNKINFKTSYHPTIVQLVYNNNNQVTKASKCDNPPIIQFKSSDTGACLLCCCEFSTELIEVHLQDPKHLKKKDSCDSTLMELFAYHKHWMNQDITYQAHQVYFYPCSPNSASCTECKDFNIFYDLLHHHINQEKHKNHILQSWKIHPTPLLELQQRVYPVEVAENNIDFNAKSGQITNPSCTNKSNEDTAVSDSSQSPHDNYCNNCLSSVQVSPVKFNFNIAYDPSIKKILYSNERVSDKVSIDEGVALYTIQLHNSTCICLLCCRDFRVNHYKGHLQGQKHLKRKSSNDYLMNLLAYHKYWISQEINYQAHQIYFFPNSPASAKCHLCNNLNVFYELVREHINEERHKNLVLKFGNTNCSSLFALQKKIYAVEPKTNSDLNQKDLSRNQVSNLQATAISTPSTSGNFPANRRFVEQYSDNSDSESDNNVSPSPKKYNGNKIQGEVKQKNANKVIALHDIVKSFNYNSTNEVHTLIERRFWSQFESETMKLCSSHIECVVCKQRLPKMHESIFNHITSKNHLVNAGLKKGLYKFYCEICNSYFAQDDYWWQHLKHEKHKDRCRKLGLSRQQKLMEYECITCKLIIFGDNMSIKRHSVGTNQDKRKRTRSITLNIKVKHLLISEENIIERTEELVREAKEMLQNEGRLIECCNAIKNTLKEIYPDCAVYPFGSQVSGLGNWCSDLDLFVDLGNMYHGNINQDSISQVKFVSNVMKLFGKKRDIFQDLNAIPGARTPIVQVLHFPTKLDCDLSFRHGLSVENTKFLRFCLEVQPIMQPFILILKEWLHYTKLSGRHISTYSLSMMVIFYFQMSGYFISVHELSQLAAGNLIIIDDWSIVDFNKISIQAVKKKVKNCDQSLKDLLIHFFVYYDRFNYEADVVCPLLGRPIKKALFLNNPKGIDLPLEMSIYVKKISLNTTEHFKAQSAMCIQDPFDLSHNLTKGCSSNVVDKLKKFCNLSAQFILTKK